MTTGRILFVESIDCLNHFMTPAAPPGFARLSAIFLREFAHFAISPVPVFIPAPISEPRIRATSHSSFPHCLNASVMSLIVFWPFGDPVHFSNRLVNSAKLLPDVAESPGESALRMFDRPFRMFTTPCIVPPMLRRKMPPNVVMSGLSALVSGPM